MKPGDKVEVHDVVQLSPECGNPKLATCMMTVTKVLDTGVQGFVQMTGENDQMGGQAFYRALWEEFEMVGKAVWVRD